MAKFKKISIILIVLVGLYLVWKNIDFIYSLDINSDNLVVQGVIFVASIPYLIGLMLYFAKINTLRNKKRSLHKRSLFV